MRIKFSLLTITIIFLMMTILGCKKEPPKTIPTVETTIAINITSTTALGGGTVSDDGGDPVTTRGVCWGIIQSPTILCDKTVDGSGLGSFISSLTDLSAYTTYYMRAYATNTFGTGYGEVIPVSTMGIPIIFNPNLNYGTVTDIENNIYKTIKIGTQTWMAENLRTTKYLNGDLIGTTTPASLDVSRQDTPKYQWAYNGNENYVRTYGRLYTWYTATDNRKICPSGWHLPTYDEWWVLIDFYGGGCVAGGPLKEVGTSHWQTPNTDATNSSGFTALPGGHRFATGQFYDIGGYGRLLSSSIESVWDIIDTWSLCVLYNAGSLAFADKKNEGRSVRCVKD